MHHGSRRFLLLCHVTARLSLARGMKNRFPRPASAQAASRGSEVQYSTICKPATQVSPLSFTSHSRIRAFDPTQS